VYTDLSSDHLPCKSCLPFNYYLRDRGNSKLAGSRYTGTSWFFILLGEHSFPSSLSEDIPNLYYNL